ncbi:MAG TPA: hypothetical protein VK453_28015 [Micromonosporaceae bacterium]|nr:hypothetical protein [Micromonosporaceae bacterium]
MALLTALVVGAAVVVFLITPCVVLACLLSDRATDAVGRVFGAGRSLAGRAWRAALTGPIGRHWSLVRLVRALGLPTHLEPAESARPARPPIAQVAADLRRLGRLRNGVATRSMVWFTAVRRAYDDRLGVACEQLEITQYLDELTGIDLDIERLRVEGELRAAGLVWTDIEAHEGHGHW